jgi:HEAT repeat protein
MVRNFSWSGLAPMLLAAGLSLKMPPEPASGSMPGSIRRDPQGSGDAVADLVAKLKSKADLAEPKLVEELAGLRTRAALEGLLDAYSAMSTAWMHREIVRSLHLFDGVPDAELPALQRLMDVATQDPEPALRHAALEGLGQCKSKGKEFLALIIQSRAEDEIRVQAMELHVGLSGPDDHAWYRELYKPRSEEKPDKDKEKKEREKEKKERREHKEPKSKDPKKKGEEPPSEPKKPRMLDGIRSRAFEVIRTELTPEELAEAVVDRAHDIRMAALLELEVRKDKQIQALASVVLAKPTTTDTDHFDPTTNEYADVRIAAAQILARLNGPKVAGDFIKRGTAAETPQELRRGLAEILTGWNDPAVNRDLLGEIGKGRAREKLFILHALAGIQDEKVDRAIERLLFDREGEVVIAACQVLAERKDKESVPQLQKLLGRTGKEKPLARAALNAIVVLRSGDPKWIDELLGMTKSEDPDVRNLALQALGQTSDKKHLPKLVEALEDKDWSTRLAALDALENLRAKEAIPAIIARMAREEGRMLAEFADVLFRLTGQTFEENAAAWDNWWKQSGDKFEFIDKTQLEKVKVAAEDWRLKQGTKVQNKFFGIRIVSHKVILVLDISLSMNELIASDYDGKSGQTRNDIAKAEMDKAIESLDPGAFFNVITFCGDVTRWMEGGLAAASQKGREEARAFVDKALLGYGTSTYDALEEAFKDPDVDTIFFLSDGQPTTGKETDPVVIREHVRQWNEHRGVVINTIALGGQHDILQWLAEDSGGKYKSYD